MFSLGKFDAQLWPELERLCGELGRVRTDGTRAAASSTTKTASRNDGRATVLVVDDDDEVRDYAATVLRDAGYRVVAVGKPSEALHRLHDAPAIDLMFTDVMLPEIDGLKLAELAKRRHPALSVLYTSGDPARFERQPVERYGGFLAKPYRSAQLERAVGEAMAHHTDIRPR
jgi:CheY-like chemotaxis protein